jgi:hypothetical protein
MLLAYKKSIPFTILLDAFLSEITLILIPAFQLDFVEVSLYLIMSSANNDNFVLF